MLNYLKKFVLDILPSVAATIIGAYVVHYYIIPAATPKSPAAAVSSVDDKADSKPDTGKREATTDKGSFVKGVAEKAAIEKTAEKASDKAADGGPTDLRKRHATPRVAKVPAAIDQTASIPDSPVVEERRDANDLARAAIERLRTTSEPPRTMTSAAPAQPAMPALPPAVTLASPEVFNAGTGAIIAPARPAQTLTPTRSADASRPLPPAEIPGPPPIDLHGDIMTEGRASTVADDMMSAAKSVFHAMLPR